MYKVLSAESCSDGDTQQPAAAAAASQAAHRQPINNPPSFFSESFASSGKQEGGATVLWEGHDIVTKETCFPASLNVNNLGKAAMLHFVSPSLLRLGPCHTQPVDH
jgi:hypothetical protein